MGERAMEVIVGTNEEFILGYQINETEDGTLKFKQSFTNHSHQGSLRKIAVSGKFLLSGGTDEVIRVFNLNRRNEVGLIMEHQGTISNITFFETSHLFSTAEDGNICIFKRGTWLCEKTLKAHNGGITGLSVHPSGKLAISVGRDKTMKTWNLIKGRRAYITNIGKIADSVHWTPSGTQFLVVTEGVLDLYEVDTGKIVHTVDFKQRVNSVKFINNDVVVLGSEGGSICLYNIEKQKQVGHWEAHNNRVKAICIYTHTEECKWIFSTSSDGSIKVWSLQLSEIIDNLENKPKLLGEVNTTCRNICMDISIPNKIVKKEKKKRHRLAKEESLSDMNETSSPEKESIKNKDNLIEPSSLKKQKVSFN
ncbi:unnamed protein product [Meganyctiphanes norvegica]|uniref:P21-activated protein kinase-interacting protein 1-like n=1 Tax=Meganyctiphanes norvegica TaxID=48144 RepID=A0AAV2R1E0_MEGNR